MITEDYVSYEVAKLLKDRGFDGETEHKIWYVIKQFSTGCHWNSCVYKVGDMTREYDNDCCISMPTLQMACKWLREVYNVVIEINSIWIVGFGYNYIARIVVEGESKKCLKHYNYYEEAVEAALKYSLENLI